MPARTLRAACRRRGSYKCPQAVRRGALDRELRFDGCLVAIRSRSC